MPDQDTCSHNWSLLAGTDNWRFNDAKRVWEPAHAIWYCTICRKTESYG